MEMTNTDPFIRPYTEADVSNMAMILERANAARDGSPIFPRLIDIESVDDIRERLAKPEAWAYIATANNNVSGFALGYPATEASSLPTYDNAEYLSLLMIDPNNWGQGFASKLLDAVTAKARERKRTQVALWTRDVDNTRARSFYEHKGYSLADETRVTSHGRQVLYLLGV